ALYSVALVVGLRQGEALGLHWADVDQARDTLRVKTALQRVKIEGEKKSRLIFAEPKFSRSKRTIPLPGVAIAALERHKKRQDEERTFAGSRWQENDLVFTTSIGTPIEPRDVVEKFKKHLHDAGLPDKRFHDLRHTCASLLLAQGVHPRVVMETLGHSGIQLTMNTYSHVMPAAQREEADRMDSLLTAPNAPESGVSPPVAVRVAVK
ncbi:MAG TPA: site-specific integrase, partial [Chloroflexota bacterium]|nr:site-specific integrase [Chloroflexota bacterium]